jgi:predicted membrane channel-forming protein YqfA (hemolysin III family)
MTKLSDAVALRAFALFILLGLVSVVCLWTLNPVQSQAQTAFALLLSVDLVVFAIASYVYRVSKWKEGVSRLPLLGGCIILLILLIVGLTL